MSNSTLDDSQRLWLLSLARSAIAARLSGQPLPFPTPPSPSLCERRGAFVTLTIEELLRGCIGHVTGVAPLWRAVRDNAISAAFEDPRFPTLSDEEFSCVDIEISVLTPLRRVASVDEIEVGRDGILIENGVHRGLLLPQVATNYSWDRETFLNQTCRKAGLENGRWRDSETVISTFSAEIFGEG